MTDYDEYTDMSQEDMCFEIKRLRQKIQVLENDKMILQEEYEIAQTIQKQGNADEDAEKSSLRESLLRTRQMLDMSTQKFRVTKRFLELEKKTMNEIKTEMNHGLVNAMKDMDTKMNIYKETVLAREEALQKKFQQVRTDLYKAREAQERYKIELHEANKEKRMLQKNLDNVEAELTIEKNKLNSQFESINCKIEQYQKEHADEVKKLKEDIDDKERQRVHFEEELAKWKLTLKLRVEEKMAVDKELADIKQKYTDNEKAFSKQLEKELDIHKSLEEERNKLMAENDILSGRIKKMELQQTKLLDSHDALQNDFKSLLTREKSLRSELCGNSNDKNEMQRKLQAISNKVSTMEADHEREMNELKLCLEKNQQLLDSALQGREREGVRAGNLAVEVKRLENLLQSNIDSTTTVKQDLQNSKAENERLKSKNSELDGQIKSMEQSFNSLRDDRDDAMNSSKLANEELKRLQQELDEKDNSLKKLQLQKIEKSNSESEISRLKNELLRTEERSEQQNIEILGLKDTVRRECEERTELMIEVSELKDQVKRLHNMHNGKSMRSQSSGGVDSSVQAQHGLKHPETPEPSMLQRIASEKSSTLTDQDAGWVKHRQSAQNNSNKSKRKSKYRS